MSKRMGPRPNKEALAIAQPMREQGATLEAICNALNERGLRNGQGNPWNKQNIYHMLRRAKVKKPKPERVTRVSVGMEPAIAHALHENARVRGVTPSIAIRDILAKALGVE